MANHLTRFNPFGDLAGFESLRGIDDFFNRFPLTSALSGRGDEPRLNIDVTETEQAYAVKAEVPGARKEDVKVSIEGNVVSIRVEKTREDVEKEGETVLRRERYHGVQMRRFSLGHDIDVAGASARCADGVLELTLPKKESSQGARQLDIQ
ncbi:Heat shock protein Hsp20 OS=Castellaniella defragrans (strain DSM / CCUG 39792 / 65Phen) OX=1437824 GN=BN940_18261 PE=3 SV=1 [Castellaniella denitrificans]|uniref:Hsp20/alpha crystallin family protein n=1 Tax=Castellaniella TaxID=359336 RepID=UPI001AD34CF2|nr:Hsp20/alpha crystallin family protein [Castellaniella sp.]MBN9402485.1 Hsp20/alpha crystallin family protein [Burkholderiales bacterium]